jgi:iron complex outermembrane receptor protein
MLPLFKEENVSTTRRAIASHARATGSGALLFLGSLIFTAGALGQVSLPASNPPLPSPAQGELSQVPLEDLMNIQVTSVSKKEQNLSEAAAAIFVITQEDIHRSGASNLPDLLRFVPGLDVSQISANNWAISSRGFNTQFANKLLVLIDGRAVYTPLLGGVNWDTQDVPLEDIDRIEVVRGPGATLWGANAVNGVINILTKTAEETRGGLMVAGGAARKGRA